MFFHCETHQRVIGLRKQQVAPGGRLGSTWRCSAFQSAQTLDTAGRRNRVNGRPEVQFVKHAPGPCRTAVFVVTTAARQEPQSKARDERVSVGWRGHKQADMKERPGMISSALAELSLCVSEPAWFRVRTHLKHEHIATAHLRLIPDVGVFNPRLRLLRSTRRGPVWSTESVFPNYLFARFVLERKLEAVRFTIGVVKVVQFGEVVPHVRVSEWQLHHGVGPPRQSLRRDHRDDHRSLVGRPTRAAVAVAPSPAI